MRTFTCRSTFLYAWYSSSEIVFMTVDMRRPWILVRLYVRSFVSWGVTMFRLISKTYKVKWSKNHWNIPVSGSVRVGGRKAYKRLSFPSDSVINNNNASTLLTALYQSSSLRIKGSVRRDGSGASFNRPFLKNEVRSFFFLIPPVPHPVKAFLRFRAP